MVNFLFIFFLPNLNQELAINKKEKKRPTYSLVEKIADKEKKKVPSKHNFFFFFKCSLCFQVGRIPRSGNKFLSQNFGLSGTGWGGGEAERQEAHWGLGCNVLQWIRGVRWQA